MTFLKKIFFGLYATLLVSINGSCSVNEKNASTATEKSLNVSASVTDYFKKLKASVEFFTLENGLEVFILPDKRSSRVFLDMAYRVGSSAENSLEKGMAHLVEHMIFKGTEKISEVDLNRLTLKYGAGANANTSYDVTDYYFLTDRENYRPFLEILADSAQNSKFDPEHLASELKAVIQELNMYQDNDYRLALDEIALEVFPPNHPYHFSIGGYTKELADMNAKNLKAFFKKNYHPKNATLFVVGNVDPNKLKSEVKEIFSPWQCDGRERSVVSMPMVIGDTEQYTKTFWKNTASAVGHLYFRAPSIENTPAHVAFELLTKVLASEKGRLVRVLVDEHKLATSVKIFDERAMHERFLHDGIFVIKFECDLANLEKCYQVICDQLKLLADSGVSDQELAEAKTAFVLDLTCQWDGLFGGFGSDSSREIILHYFATGDKNRFFDLPAVCNQTEVADLKALANKYLKTDFAKKLSILPIDKQRMPLWLEFDRQRKNDQLSILEKHKRTAPLEEQRFIQKTPEAKICIQKFDQADEVFELDNGLKVLAKNVDSVPLVACSLFSKSADKNSENKDSFAARVAASVLLESQSASKDELLKKIASFGAKVIFDLDHSSLISLFDGFGDAALLFSTIVSRANVTDDAVKKQAAIMASQLRKKSRAPREAIWRNFFKFSFPGTKLDWDFDSVAQNISQLSSSEVSSAYQKEFNPKNYVLAIVGKLPNNWKSIVQNSFGKWSALKTLEESEAFVSQKFDSKSLPLPLPCDQTYYFFGRGSEIKLWSEEQAKLAIVNRLLFEGFGSKLFEIRERTGLFYTARGEFAGRSTSMYSFDWVGGIVNPANTGAFKKEIEQMFLNCNSGDFDPVMLAGAKIEYASRIATPFSSIQEQALMMARLEVMGKSPVDLQKLQEIVNAMEIGDLVDLCNRYCSLNNMVEVAAGGQ